MKVVTSWYIRNGEWAFILFLLNMLWFLCSLSGLIVLGVFLATVAMFAVTRKLIMSEEKISIFYIVLEDIQS
ncbi:DUF624 domain-containing protein [Pseudalkalibacillus sp. A8]|uniref:DUF624 domain-containing protein n=1 Tax=Pseudalkalibacillus sp. A8 TaxID=3382641 RepID=UPI0038B4358A